MCSFPVLLDENDSKSLNFISVDINRLYFMFKNVVDEKMMTICYTLWASTCAKLLLYCNMWPNVTRHTLSALKLYLEKSIAT